MRFHEVTAWIFMIDAGNGYKKYPYSEEIKTTKENISSYG